MNIILSFMLVFAVSLYHSPSLGGSFFKSIGLGHDHEHGDEHDHGSSKAIGEGKAIEEVDELKGFRLSPQAIETIGLRYRDVQGSQIEIENDTLVASKNIRGVYRYRDGFFKMVEATIDKKTKNGFVITVPELKKGDQVITHGVKLLRVSDVYSTDESEYGHSH